MKISYDFFAQKMKDLDFMSRYSELSNEFPFQQINKKIIRI